MLVRVLLAPLEEALQERLLRLLAGSDLVVERRPAAPPPWELAEPPACDLVLARRGLLPEPVAGSISRLRSLPDRPGVVVLADREDPADRAALLAAGAMAVLSPELADGALGSALAALVGKRRGEARLVMEQEREHEPMALGDFASQSPSMREFLQIARRVCGTDSSVLVLGETGVGKERLARAIHTESPRGSGPFIAVHCGAISENLLESELFGHERGAFTGATRAHRGYFELAHGGTLFLDEIGDMPIHLQVKLLRALQERQVQRLGAEHLLPVDVRVLAATNRDLHREMAEGRFRADLYYRLSVVSLTIPPLRERRADIEPLAMGFLLHFRRQIRSAVEALDSGALRALQAYPWPGNVRELANVMERAILLCHGRAITLADLPENITASIAGRQPAAVLTDLDPRWLERPLALARAAFLLAFERRYLEALLRETGGRIDATARRAGIDPRSLRTKMRRHGLRKEDYKPPRPTR